MSVARVIVAGDLPSILEGADWRHYRGSGELAADWSGFARMWWGIGWVRYQAFERCADAEGDAEGWT